MPSSTANGAFRPPARKVTQPAIKKQEPQPSFQVVRHPSLRSAEKQEAAHSDFQLVRRPSLRAAELENQLQIKMTEKAVFSYVIRESQTYVVLSEEPSEKTID